MTWTVVLVAEVEDWFLDLDDKSSDHVEAVIDLLAERGPSLGRPTVDRISGSRMHNLKELRVSTMRLLFAFDPEQQAIILTAGDKSGQWKSWYEVNIPLAEERYEAWINGYSVER